MTTPDDRGAAASPLSETSLDGAPLDLAWLRAALDGSSDAAAVMAPDTTLMWMSAGCSRLIGFQPEEMVGRSMVDFLHPDDLERAVDMVGLATAGLLQGDRLATPAFFRIRHADGGWIPLEINTSSVDGNDDMFLLIRQSNDLVLGDRLLEAMIDESPLEEQLALVVDLGRWRHRTEGYVIIYRDAGRRQASSAGVTSPLLTGLGDTQGLAPWDQAMSKGATVTAVDLDDRQLVPADIAEAARAEGFVAVMAVPVPDPAHRAGACIVVWSTHDGPDAAGQRYPVENMKRSLTLLLQWRSQLHNLERGAHEDYLTGLASRGRFFELAEERVRIGPVTLLYIDLDGFKAVNDEFGHAAGDEVLRVLAARLSQALGPDAVIGRLGGDEFAVVCPADTQLERAQSMAAAVGEAAAERVELTGVSVTVGASVGIAEGVAGESVDEVLDRADAAMLGSKAVRRGAWRTAPRA
jgi:diguanylate cyclase (GGDEF)-like protein/PAS domain S-box-containing protein